MKLDFLVLICLTVSSLCKAQSINGIVLDLKTNAPIESAAVYFDNTTIGTSTNDKGEFEIEQNTNVTSDLIISFLGYEKVTISDYDADSFYKVLLQESTNTLDEVII
ncbi:MAG: carboxypeptidase-like regulatory domain-containing protein, partial [Psychroserpens sp.]